MNGLYYCDWFQEYTAGLVRSVVQSNAVTLIVRESSTEFSGRAEDEAELHRDLVQAGVDLHLLPGRYSSLKSLFEIRKITRRRGAKRFDYFHLQQTADPRFLWTVLRTPTVYTVHEPKARKGLDDRLTLRTFTNVMTRRLYQHLADVIVVHTQSGLAGLSPRVARKAVVIPHGVETCEIAAAESSKTILFFGRTAGYKGIETLLAAMTEVWKVEPHARLRILASPGEGTCSYEITDDRVTATWEGYSKSELEQALSSACAICLPYTSASGSGVGAQAYGSGKPIVASDVEGLRELVSHDELLVRPGDVNDLARALILVLRNDYGRQTVDPERTWPNVALAHIAAYKSLTR